MGGGVAVGFDMLGPLAPPPRCWVMPLIIAFDPMLRGNVCDLFVTPKFPGRLLPTVNFRPEATHDLYGGCKFA